MKPFDKEELDQVLTHYGILGMRWGKRKGRTSSKTKPSTKKVAGENRDDDDSPSKKSKTAKVHDMSDKELQDAVKRLQMEKQYKELTKKELSLGQKVMNDIIAPAAKQTATTYVAKYMAKGVEAALKSATK